MLTSDQDLDASSDRQVITSPSLHDPTIVTELSIEHSKVMPIFSEATAMAIRLAKAPVAILMTTGKAGCQIGSISGLEKFSCLPSKPNLLVELAGLEYCYAQVMSNEHRFSIPNCQLQPQLAQFRLFRVHGVQAYLGLPIVTAAKDRLGTIAILDFKPRQFSDRDLGVLQIVSRLVASEFERKLLSQSQLEQSLGNLHYRSKMVGFDDAVAAAEYGQRAASTPQLDLDTISSDSIGSSPFSAGVTESASPSSPYPQVQGEIQFKLLTHLAQELRTPLTSILGMASVLQQEVYGSLSGKQKDYLGIIHQSGQQLVTLVDEISQLSEFDAAGDKLERASAPQGGRQPQSQLNLRSVDLEMLCQLAIQSLEPLAQRKNQQLGLDFTSGGVQQDRLTEQMWSIDKDKIRQIVYYLCLSAIHLSAVDARISIRLANFIDRLQIQILTDDPEIVLPNLDLDGDFDACIAPLSPESATSIDRSNTDKPIPTITQDLRVSLGLSLSSALAASHGGRIEVIANNRGYQFTLPRMIEG
jgi:signal transduction histidine kinase